MGYVGDGAGDLGMKKAQRHKGAEAQRLDSRVRGNDNKTGVVMAKKKVKRRTRAIVEGYLEKVNASIFDKYQSEITEMIRGHQGLYALYRNDKLYYVGLATNLKGRIKHHLNDKHKGRWTHFSLYVIRKSDHVKELESLLLRIAYPEGNRQRGKLTRSKNLLPGLKLQVKSKIKIEIEDLFKSTRIKRKVVKKKTVQKNNEAKSERPLVGEFPGGKVIYARYKGVDYKAWVNRRGRIRLSHNGKRYDTPSAAGAAVRGRATNGWVFWKVKNAKKELVALRTVRKQ